MSATTATVYEIMAGVIARELRDYELWFLGMSTGPETILMLTRVPIAAMALDSAARVRLAEALGDTPQTVIAVHRLRRGLGRAWVDGDPARFRAAIVQGDDLPDEPDAFGADPEAIWELLQHVEGWTCVSGWSGFGSSCPRTARSSSGASRWACARR